MGIHNHHLAEQTLSIPLQSGDPVLYKTVLLVPTSATLTEVTLPGFTEGIRNLRTSLPRRTEVGWFIVKFGMLSVFVIFYGWFGGGHGT